MLALGEVLLGGEHGQGAELQHAEHEKTDGQQGVFGAVRDKLAHQVARAKLHKQPNHPPDAKDTEDLHLLEGETGKQIGPAEAAEEVVGAIGLR